MTKKKKRELRLTPPPLDAQSEAYEKALAKLTERYNADIKAARAVHAATLLCIKESKEVDEKRGFERDYGREYERAERQCRSQHAAAQTRLEASKRNIAFFYFRAKRATPEDRTLYTLGKAGRK